MKKIICFWRRKIKILNQVSSYMFLCMRPMYNEQKRKLKQYTHIYFHEMKKNHIILHVM